MEAVPFDHTYILYDPTDVVSMACVHLLLLPVYIMVFYTLWFLITREIEPVIVVGGHLGLEVVNKIVKHIIRQPRPDFHKDFGKGSYGSSYGMPLAHSQFAGFFAAYFLCVVLTKVPVSTLSKVVVSAGLLTVGFLVPFLRVYLMYHTWPQVAVGVMLGVAVGLVYFVVASFARQFGLVDWVLRWPIVRWFSVKDGYYHNYQSFEQEFQAVEAAKAKKAAKKAL